MPLLVSAVAVIAVVVALNLLLTLMLIRRVRTLSATAGSRRAQIVDGPTVGSPLPRLQLTAVGGAAVETGDAATDDLVLAFLAAGCGPCHEQLPELRSLVSKRVSRGGRALVVALAPDGDAAEFVEAFLGLAPVVIENGDAAVSQAFDVTGYPTYVECAAGLVQSVHGSAASLRDTARV